MHVRSGWQTEAWSYGLVSPYAHLLQRANYKPIDATDHNDLLKPMPFTSGSTGGSPMFTAEEERKIVEVLTYPYEPFGRAALVAEVIAAVNANAKRIEGVAGQLTAVTSMLTEVLTLLRTLGASHEPGGSASGLDIARALVALLGGNTRLQTPALAPEVALMNRPFAAPPVEPAAPDLPTEEGLAAAVAGIEMLARSQRRVAPPVADTPT